MASKSLLNFILDEEFLQTLAKSADLYKIGTNTALDAEEIRIGLKVVPRAVMSLLINELSPMDINSSKDVELPFGEKSLMRVNKNANDDYTGSIYSDNKLVYDFKNRSIPGLGIIILSTFELYDLDDLPQNKLNTSEDMEDKIQRMIQEKMELHSLVSRVVENKMAEREAIHKLMMSKLTDALSAPLIPNKTPEPPVEQKPIEIEATDISKKEAPAKKGSPLKEFLDRKKNKQKEFHVEMAKSEQISCPDCNQIIFGPSGYSGCICLGENYQSKLWIRKSEDGIQIRFSKNWNPENIELLLETLRAKK